MPELNTNENERWFVLTVAPRHELSVKENLESKGFDVSVPTYRVRRRWSDRVKTLTMPLFPGYAFCRFAVYKRGPVLNTPGVRGVISFGSRFAALEDHEVGRIHRLVASGLSLEPLAGLRAGMQVKIIDGPLLGVCGVLVHMNGSASVVVNVELLNRSVSVRIEPDSIAALNEMSSAISA